MKIGSRYVLGLSCPGEGPVGYCEHSNENSGCIKDRKFFDYVRDCHLLMKKAVFAPVIKNRCRVTRILCFSVLSVFLELQSREFACNCHSI
jgi:hypothetical protein